MTDRGCTQRQKETRFLIRKQVNKVWRSACGAAPRKNSVLYHRSSINVLGYFNFSGSIQHVATNISFSMSFNTVLESIFLPWLFRMHLIKFPYITACHNMPSNYQSLIAVTLANNFHLFIDMSSPFVPITCYFPRSALINV